MCPLFMLQESQKANQPNFSWEQVIVLKLREAAELGQFTKK